MSGFFGSGIGPQKIKRAGVPATPVPVLGAELANSAFATNEAWIREAPWSIGSGVASKTATPGGALYQAAGIAGQWWQFQFNLMAVSTTIQALIGSAVDSVSHTTTGEKMFVRRLVGINIGLYGANGNAATVDNLSLRNLLTSSLLSTRTYASANCDLSVQVTLTAGTQAGLCARLDSATSPANFIIAYLDGTGVAKVDKCVGGTYTNVISGAVTYAAGRVLRLMCSGNNVSAYYNGTQVGSTVTVSDAGIVSNTRHGKFNTYASNVLANYVAA